MVRWAEWDESALCNAAACVGEGFRSLFNLPETISFLRAPDGTFTTFDPPDAGTGAYQGTYPAIFSGTNPKGATIGEYLERQLRVSCLSAIC